MYVTLNHISKKIFTRNPPSSHILDVCQHYWIC
uniref:Uncharacterized protein n=1 Tax=Arundo donax TaxID=35708 RepID=A0A0A8Y1K5_ARUDO